MKQSYLYFFFLVLLFAQLVNAQQHLDTKVIYEQFREANLTDSSSKFILGDIIIYGNKKTKDYVILREMNIKSGDTISAHSLFETIQASRDLLYNTNLFSEVNIIPLMTSAYSFALKVIVLERWYIYPAPQFKLIDRNFNEWWKTYNADFKRVSYGLKFTHYNISGRGDQLNVIFLNGYSRNFYANYVAPYSNPRLTEGFSVAMGFAQNKEFVYNTSYNNKLLQYNKNDFGKTAFFANASYRKRNGFYNRHYFTAQLNYIKVDDSVITPKYNSNYFNSPHTKMLFADLTYGFQYINTDNINYPLKGKIYSFLITKRGLGWSGGLNMLALDVSYRKYYTHKKNFYSGFQLFTKIKLPFEQAYINQRAMGYGDFYLSGLEYYVIDGVAAAISKYNLNKKIFSLKIPMPFKIKQVPYIPFTVYSKVYAEAGYSFNKNKYATELNNRFLYTAGFGFDLLSLYDLKLSIEYSINQLGEKGLFLHTRSIL